MINIKVHFLGAAGTVTGSKFLIETDDLNILVDCGLFQGVKKLRQLNWSYLPINVEDIDVVLLTHGHLDHTGFLPRLVSMGFKGKIMSNAPTLKITKIILQDSAKIQMEDAERANRYNTTRHEKALPLYDLDDVDNMLEHFYEIKPDTNISLSENVSTRFFQNGHIIGSSSISIQIGQKNLLFSGDVGRTSDPLMFSPTKPTRADYLFIESTYGNRRHADSDTKAELTKLINTTIDWGGSVIIPSFSVERTQMLMYLLWQLHKEKRIPNVPMIMDSPMGANVIDVFRQHPDYHKLDLEECDRICRHFKIIRNYKDSLKQVEDLSPKIVIAGSGMITGGRVLSYLQQHLNRPESCVLLAGFQAEGTRGRRCGSTQILRTIS